MPYTPKQSSYPKNSQELRDEALLGASSNPPVSQAQAALKHKHFSKKYDFNYLPYLAQLKSIFEEISQIQNLTWEKLRKILGKYPKDKQGYFSKQELVVGYEQMAKAGLLTFSEKMLAKIRMKPVRSQSGVTVVTVLTKPFPCPGKCIFCPNDVRMPKSYLSDEPGAQRAEKNNFDPYLQTYRRLLALKSIGHPLDKIEIIILGGTWSFYPEKYQIWFVKRIFEALNDFSVGKNQIPEIEKQIDKPLVSTTFSKNFLSKKEELSKQEISEIQKEYILNAEEITKLAKSSYNQAVTKVLKLSNSKILNSVQEATWEELEIEQDKNATAHVRSVGLVIETRPDKIDAEEVLRIRRLGCTKTQIGFQSLDDEVLKKNHRGHKVEATRKAVRLLRQAGFKVHAHWMANLYGSSVEKDIADYQKMFSDPDFLPDELKLYPCSVIETAELMDYYKRGEYQPYTREELEKVLITTIISTPEYCRLTRIIRDIPGHDIVVGNKITNFRQIIENKMQAENLPQNDIRAREVKNLELSREDLELEALVYETTVSTEIFLQFITRKGLKNIPARRIAGFLRLSLPSENKVHSEGLTEWLDQQNKSESASWQENSLFPYWNLPKNNELKEASKNLRKSKHKHPFCSELDDAAIIREVHVYGQVVKIGDKSENKAQHLGLGKALVATAKQISKDAGYSKLAVISAIGTRDYYTKQGFELQKLYQVAELGR